MSMIYIYDSDRFFLNGRKAVTISMVHKNCNNVTSSYKAIIDISLSSFFPSFFLILLIFILTTLQSD